MPPRRSQPLARALALVLVALLGGLVAVVGPVSGAGESAVQAAASAWSGIFGERPEPSAGQRMIVVLEAPSLADRVAAAELPPGSEEQKRWVAEADAAQRVLLQRLRDRGVRVTRDRTFTRTFNGFSARLDSRAQAELERSKGVVGVFPVRTVYPASVTSEALAQPEFRAGAGRRPDVGLPGFDGTGVRIALLDGGVDLDHPLLHGRVLQGIDLVGKDRRAAAERKPDEPSRFESHATRMAGVLVGSDGPGGLAGVAPGARVLPIRVLGWERASDGSYALLGRGDVLLAGFERAVDPDGDGDVEDAAQVTLAAVVEPYASFPDSPEARAVAGATRLGTLVVAPAGNDGRGGRSFGTVGAPAGTAAALAVGALDSRLESLAARTRLSVGGDEALDTAAAVVGAVQPEGDLPVTALLGATLGDPGRPGGDSADGSSLADFFSPQGVSRVAGRAVLLESRPGLLDTQVRNAAAAGASAVLVAGTAPGAGSLDLDEATAVPVVAVSARAGTAALESLAAREVVSVSFGATERRASATARDVAAFSSGGVAFGGHVKPDVVAPGVGIATADGGSTVDGSPRYATATGTSVAAAVVAGSAAVLAQARPGLSPAQLRSLLVGSAEQLVETEGEAVPVTVQGAGVVDPAAAASAEVAVEPATLAFGRVGAEGWRVTQTITVRNLSTRMLDIAFGITRDRWTEPELSFAASPSNLSLRAGASADVTLVATASAPAEGEAGGAFVVSPQGSRALRVPWAVSFRPDATEPLLSAVRLSNRRFRASDAAPPVLAFGVGDVDADPEGQSVEPVQLLVAEVWTKAGKRLGVLTRLHDLLPGRYAFGVTGRGPQGRKLGKGDYVLRLTAFPVAGDAGARATSVDVPFTITG
jgi:hypothetical protein